jgi:hypothetical protein
MAVPRASSWGRLAPIAAVLVGLCFPASSVGFDSSGWGVLENGRVGDYEWSVQAKREGGPAVAGSRSSRPPCLMVRIQRQINPFNVHRIRFRTCADGSGRLAPTDEPLIASSSLLGSSPEPEITAVGMVVPAAVRSVRVSLAEGGWRTVDVDPLTRAQTSRTGLGRVRYAAFSVRGQWEAQRVITLSGSGRALWDSGEQAATE